MTGRVVGSSTTAVRRLLHVRHALTAGTVPGLVAALVPPSSWWQVLRTSAAGDVAVVGTDRYPAGPDPVVRLTVTDPDVAAAIDRPTVVLTLDQAELTHTFLPAPQTVTAVLLDTDGRPFTGGAVTVVPDGVAVPVPATELPGSPGSYRTAAATWPGTGTAFELREDAAALGRFRLDPFARDTRIHAVKK